jgi:UbiD family decarboxylase
MPSTVTNDLRQFIQRMLENDDILVVNKEVDPHFELAAIVSKSQKQSDKAILFNKVSGTEFPVLANIYGSFSRMAEMVDTNEKGLHSQWKEIFDTLPPHSYDYINEVPVPEDIKQGALGELPQITWREKDVGTYITAAVFLAKDPENGIPNLSFARCLMQGDDSKMVCCIDAPHDLAKYQAKAEAKGEALEVAILIGAPPPVFLAAVASLPIDQDELQLAAHIAGGSLEMYRCQQLDLLVPTGTEIIIEATIRPNERAEDGPFGEFLGYYCDVNTGAFVLDIKNVSWREGAYYHGLLCGSREDLTALAVSWGNRIYRGLVDKLPGILDVTINPTLFGSIIKIDKQSEQHPQDVIDAVFRLNPLYNRMCIVVDKDIDIHDLESVWWSFLTRGNVDTRTHVFSDLAGIENANYEFSGYLGIDATMSLDKSLDRSMTPGEDKINLDDYFEKT